SNISKVLNHQNSCDIQFISQPLKAVDRFPAYLPVECRSATTLKVGFNLGFGKGLFIQINK
ncbi:MAG: hypothetical protein KAI93_09590, partial [Desulfobacterales bacterium]|nr:hypothetical protein [Desulfobacterales bacterium]